METDFSGKKNKGEIYFFIIYLYYHINKP